MQELKADISSLTWSKLIHAPQAREEALCQSWKLAELGKDDRHSRVHLQSWMFSPHYINRDRSEEDLTNVIFVCAT